MSTPASETAYKSRQVRHSDCACCEQAAKSITYLEQENSVLHSKLRSLEMKLEKAEKALAVEREACAKVAEEYGLRVDFTPTTDKEAPFLLGKVGAACDIAQLIRGRGEK
jgi:hypothetical protein